MTKNRLPDLNVLYRILSKFKMESLLLFVFLLVDVGLETLSIGAVVPLLNVAVSKAATKQTSFSWLFGFFLNMAESEQIVWISAAILFLFIVRAANNLAAKYYSSWFTNHLREYWSNKIFGNYFVGGFTPLNMIRQGALSNTVNYEPFFAAKGVGLLIDIIVSFLLMTSVTALLLIFNWRMTLLAIGILGLTTGLVWKASIRFSQTLGANRLSLNEQINQIICESAAGWRQIKMFSLEHELFREFKGKLKELVRGVSRFELVSSIPREAGEISIVFAVVSGILFFKFIKHAELPNFLPEIVFCSVSFMKLFSAATAILKKGMEVANCMPSIVKVNAQAELSPIKENTTPKAPAKLCEVIEIKNVDFQFSDGGPLFKGLSLNIRKGEVIGLVGKSGVGKSTLCDLLAGLVDAYSGTILIDGVPLSDIEPMQWKAKIAYVTQDVFLFNASVLKNIQMGCSNSSFEEVIKATEVAQARDFIESLPRGFQTILGPGGVQLSGGQKQRIALARALVRQPELLILDESTSCLDYELEEKIINSLTSDKTQRTIVLVTHRTHSLRVADRLLLLQPNQIREISSLSELYKTQLLENQKVASENNQGVMVQFF